MLVTVCTFLTFASTRMYSVGKCTVILCKSTQHFLVLKRKICELIKAPYHVSNLTYFTASWHTVVSTKKFLELAHLKLAHASKHE